MANYFSRQKLRAVGSKGFVGAGALAVAAALAVPSVGAQETPSKAPMAKLMQAPPGRVIFEFGPKPKVAASASAPVSTPAPAAQVGEASATAAPGGSSPVQTATSGMQPDATVAPGPALAAEPKPHFLGNLPPPSGRSLNAARRLDAPDQGIVIKDAPKTPK